MVFGERGEAAVIGGLAGLGEAAGRELLHGQMIAQAFAANSLARASLVCTRATF